ncbi:protein FAM135A [Trifolium pratense]|uniref:Protein FAM135A n=1 Tax=Trifolium pratense TaxID=57577 RepID=A0A2K3PA25_TRIPR|nr:protein FAM135A [Trifolium pratense]
MVSPDLDQSSIYGAWKIDDTENSFSTQTFRIKYAKQDVHLCMMIAFNLSRSKSVDFTTNGVILKFELIYAATLEDGADMQASLDDSPAAIHEFRIPPKALLGLHSYCPVHFDALHAVLVDVSVHVSLLKAASHSSASKGFRGVASQDVKDIVLVRSLLTSRDLLLEELHKINKAVNEAIDTSDFVSNMNNADLINFVVKANGNALDEELGQGKPKNGLERENRAPDIQNAEKVEMPHHYINSGNDESSRRSMHKRVSSLWKLPDEPLVTAISSAEHHRKSIAQMRINNRSIQDMQIFGDPLRIPVVLVERVMNVPRRSISEISFLGHVGLVDSHSLTNGLDSDTSRKKSAPQRNVRVLKIVVFVHGFQACLVDFIAKLYLAFLM